MKLTTWQIDYLKYWFQNPQLYQVKRNQEQRKKQEKLKSNDNKTNSTKIGKIQKSDKQNSRKNRKKKSPKKKEDKKKKSQGKVIKNKLQVKDMMLMPDEEESGKIYEVLRAHTATADLNEYTKDEIMSYLNHIAKLGKSMKGQRGCHPSRMEMERMQVRWNDPRFMRMKTKIWQILNNIDQNERKKRGDNVDFESQEGLKIQGDRCLMEKDYGGAMNNYTQALEKSDLHDPSLYAKRAFVTLEIARSMNTDEFEPDRVNGFYYNIIDDCDSAIKIDPKQSQSYKLKAKALIQLGRHKEAIKIVMQGLRYNPENKILNALKLYIQKQL